MKKNNLMRITALFFVLMFCFTILSRAAYQEGTAVVTVEKPSGRMIAHQVTAVGKIEQNQEYAVVTEPDQRVTAIYVQEGQRVTKGDLLFEIDTRQLDEQILHQQQEMEKFHLQMEDADSQKEVSKQQKANEQSRASEDYSLNVNRANTQLSRAGRQLQEAKEKLEEYYRTSGIEPVDSTVKERLEKDCDEKQAAYIQAQQELTTLQWNIEQAVDAALQEQERQRMPVAPEPVNHTAPDDHAAQTNDPVPSDYTSTNENTKVVEDSHPVADHSDMITEGDHNYDDFSYDDFSPAGNVRIENWMEDSDSGIPDVSTEIAVPETDAEKASSADLIPEVPEQGERMWTETDSPESDNEEQETGIFFLTSSETEHVTTSEPRASAQETVGTNSLSTTDAAGLEKQIREKYQPELDAARKKVQEAEAEWESAQSALAQYRQEQLTTAGTQNAEMQQQLTANVKAAQDAYTDAAISANEASVTGNRAIRTADLPEGSDSTGRINEITYEQMQLALEKLENLKKLDGKITAPVDGLVTKVQVTTGEKTADSTAVLLADLSKGSHFAADITKEQQKYLGTGDLVTIKPGNKKKTLEELAVTSVTADENDESTWHVTVQLPENDLDIGTSATLELTKKSQTYSVCVPLSALHLDDKNNTYVLIPDTFETIMGTEIRARKVNVSVAEQNELYAALTDGALSAQQDILTHSDKPVDEGSRIRISK